MSDSSLDSEAVAGWLPGIAAELRAAGLPLNVHSNAYAATLRVKAGPGILFGFSAYSSAAAAQFIQVHDKGAAPATGDIPVAVFTVATIAHLAVSYIFPGRFFHTGIWVVNSSTGPTYTAGAADTFFDAQFV